MILHLPGDAPLYPNQYGGDVVFLGQAAALGAPAQGPTGGLPKDALLFDLYLCSSWLWEHELFAGLGVGAVWGPSPSCAVEAAYHTALCSPADTDILRAAGDRICALPTDTVLRVPRKVAVLIGWHPPEEVEYVATFLHVGVTGPKLWDGYRSKSPAEAWLVSRASGGQGYVEADHPDMPVVKAFWQLQKELA